MRPWLVRSAQRLGTLAVRAPAVPLLAVAILAVAGGGLLADLRPHLAFEELVPATYPGGTAHTDDFYPAYRHLNQEYGGDNWDYYVFHAGNVTDVPVLRGMEAVASRVLADHPTVEGTLSLAELVKVMHRQTTGTYAFPPEGSVGDQQVRAYVDLLFQNPQSRDQIVGSLVSADNRTAQMVLVLDPGLSPQEYRAHAQALKETALEASDTLVPARLIALSVDTVYLRLDDVALAEGLPAVVATILLVLIVSAVLFRDPLLTAVGAANLAFAALGTLALAALLGPDFSIFTLLAVGLVIGLGDDYTTYAIGTFREARRSGVPLLDAVRHTQAELASTQLRSFLVTVAGFAALLLSGFPAIMAFGGLIAFGTTLAYLGSLSLVPALLGLVDRVRRPWMPTTGPVRGLAVTAWAVRRRKPLTVAFTVAFVAAAGYAATSNDIRPWGGSYAGIFDDDTYEMQAYDLISAWIGIPVEAVVLVDGDASDPALLRAIDALDRSMAAGGDSVHGLVRADSLADLVRSNYQQSLLQPQPLPLPGAMAGLVPLESRGDPVDRDGDGLPDDADYLQSMYAAMRQDPATALLMERVLQQDGRQSAVRVRIDIELQGAPPAENARLALGDIEQRIDRTQEAHPVLGPDPLTLTGMGVVIPAVQAAVVRATLVTTAAMGALVAVLLGLMSRRVAPALLLMAPLAFGVAVQYLLLAVLGHEITYIAVIVTSVLLAFGIDLCVGTYDRFRAALAKGLGPTAAIEAASGRLNAAMAGSLLTDAGVFLLMPLSQVTWAAQAAVVLLGAVTAMLAAALLWLPGMLAWDAHRNPAAYGSDVQSAASAAPG